MVAKKIKTKTIKRSAYRTYLKKASEFYDIMLQAKNRKKWNAVGLNAVHCAISSSDAMLVFYGGIRSTSDDHLAVIDLLSTSIKLPDGKPKCETLRKILVKKSIIEYENRDFTQKEALEILKLTERFYDWVVSSIT
ncbi:MAG TPA: HEPN domain-containing protein [bacterium]|nr:HEPN domain-containing protein [bacterium]